MSTYYYPTIDPTIISEPINQQYNNLYGYNLLSQIYKNLINTVTQYSTGYNLKFKQDKNLEIQEKLERLQQLEKEIQDELNNAELKRYLQVASRGYIDPSRIPDKNLPEVLEKHANLLNLTTKYNTKVLNLANILKTMNNVLAEKTSRPNYGLNMSVNYPVYTPYVTY
jgi:DNA repair ATPase RecN